MQKEFELFKSLFASYPNIAILHIDNTSNFLGSCLENIKTENTGNIKYIKFEEEKDARLKATAREYEYIVLSDILSYCPNKDKILKLMYRALENSGNIIILEKKTNYNKEEIMQAVDESGLQAVNNIDLFEEYNLITAKKMHNWDNGL